MGALTEIWGVNEHITPSEIAARAFVMFFIALGLIRISGMRAFGKGSAFDSIVTFLVGGILVRGVIAATPFISSVVAGFVLVLIHRILSLLAVGSTTIGNIVKGKKFILYKDGDFVHKNMLRTGITKHDILEGLRKDLQSEDLHLIEDVNMERNGEVSFVKKSPAS